MANLKISELTEATTIDATDVLVFVDISANETKKIQFANLFANFETPSGAVDGTNATFVCTRTPRCVYADGGVYFNNYGYTLAGLTITMSFYPSQFVRVEF